jgi:hypothetical protein
MANYALGLYFLYKVISVVMTMQAISTLKDILLKTVWAALAINFSWFMLAQLINFSIVLTAAIGSLPAQVLETERSQIQDKFIVPEQYTVSIDQTSELWFVVSTGGTVQQLWLETVLPQADNIAGPLYFLWVSVYKLFEQIYIDPKINTIQALTFDMILSLFIILLFVIPLTILAIVNMARVFFIWVWIMLSPILLMDAIFQRDLGKDIESDTAKNFFSFNALIGLIFLPVVNIAAISLVLILAINITDILLWSGAASLQALGEWLCINIQDTNAVTVGCQMSFIKIVWAWFGGTLLSVATAILVGVMFWWLVKMSFQVSSFTAAISTKLYEFGESALGAIPLYEGAGYSALSSGVSNEVAKESAALKDRLWIGAPSTAAQNIINDLYKTAWIEAPVHPISNTQQLDINNQIKRDGITPSLWTLNSLKSLNQTFSALQPHISQRVSQPLVQEYLTGKRLGSPFANNVLWLQDADFKDNKIFSNAKFMTFLDSYLGGADPAVAIKAWQNARTMPTNMMNKKYGW